MRYLEEAKLGFDSLKVDSVYKKQALKFLEVWLNSDEFKNYHAQIIHLIKNKHFSCLLDCFYQVLPFGTGGRRGEVGVGPNRINPWTIQASAQGHSQYLIKKYGQKEAEKGIVLCYDNRQFFGNEFLNKNLKSPIDDITSKDLAQKAAQVYTANGLKSYLFEDIRSTPELSFTIRHLQTIGGCMISASHNPPTHNGKKVYDKFGGQLIPPFDEELVNEVTQNVKEIKVISLENNKLLEIIGEKVDQAYLSELNKLAVSQEEKNVKVVYSPLHGTGITSVFPMLKNLGYDVFLDKKTANISGKFENVTFNIPNPEVPQSFDTILPFAKKIDADLILSSDPDADRIGAMYKDDQNNWQFLNGNQIAALILEYLIEKKAKPGSIVIKTEVTTNLITEICQKNHIEVIGDLLVGFKYIGEEVNKLEAKGEVDRFLFAAEESHGYMTGNYVRDKDAAAGAIYLTELANELKNKNKTIGDYLSQIYSKYGLFKNYLTEIRLPGASGMSQIAQIQAGFRKNKPTNFGRFKVKKMVDFLERKPIVSQTDRASKNCLAFYFEGNDQIKLMRLAIRPSGTEPKIKMYFELGSQSFKNEGKQKVEESLTKTLHEIEIEFMTYCYRLLGVNFPKRGFKLFNQIPLLDKLKYFEVEEEICKLKNINKKERRKQLEKILKFLGSNPVEKVNLAFKEKYKVSLEEYLKLN
jgi:phosphoglucomutase/phosphomannomutase